MSFIYRAAHFYLAFADDNPFACVVITGLFVFVIAAMIDSAIFEPRRKDKSDV